MVLSIGLTSGGVVGYSPWILHSEEFHPVPLPTDMRFTVETQIVNLEDHLALEMWIMDDDDGAWSKTYSISCACIRINSDQRRAFMLAGVGFAAHGVSSSQPRIDIFHYLGVFLRWARLRLFVLAALLTCSLFSCDDALSCAGRPIFLRWLDCFGVRDDFIKMMVSLLLWKLFFANT
ncbi:BnaC03g24180D [Brassica napus]|nr:unnamed protein product [Brassica napus]CDY44226.1 BnaC03g24180D [Brassica napus]